MIKDLNQILVEWSYRTSDGKPDVKNKAKLLILENVLNDFGWSREARAELLGSLMEAPKQKDDKIDPETKVKYKIKDKDGKDVDKETTYKSAINREKDSPAYIAAKALQGDDGEKDDGEKLDTGPEFDRNVDSNKGIDPGYERPVGDDGEEKDKGEQKPKNVNQVSGDEKEDDNKVKNEVLKHGYNGMEDATGKKPAPGTPGSAFNEITSGEGVKMLEEDESLSEKELAQKIFNQFGNSALGQEQKRTSGLSNDDYPDEINDAIKKAVGPKPPHSKNNPQNPEALKKAEKDKAVMSKCIIAARSAKQKHKISVERTNKLQKKGLLGKNTKTKTFYGADSSLDAQVKIIEEAKRKGAKVLLPNGKEVNSDDAIKFIKAGGGGANPSDTATFVVDEDGNVMLQFHSDKMATSDIQDNSTLAKESDNYMEYISKQIMKKSEKDEAKRIVKKYDEEIQEIEENYNNQATPIAKRLQDLPLDEQLDVIEKDKGTLKKNVQNAIFAKESGNFKKKYRKYLPAGKEPEDLTDEEKYQMVLKLVVADEGKVDDTKVVNKVASAVSKSNPKLDGLDVKGNLASQRRKVVDLQRRRVEELNKTEVDVDGVKKGLGEIMEAEESIRGYHLSMMDEHDYDENDSSEDNRMKGIMNASLDINMGGNIVTGKVMKKCMNVENTTEMKQKFVLREPEGKDKKGRDARYTYDDKDNVTGKKVHVYALNDEGDEIEIGFKTYRSKAGADGKTNNTMQYSKQMRDCFETGEKP